MQNSNRNYPIDGLESWELMSVAFGGLSFTRKATPSHEEAWSDYIKTLINLVDGPI